MTIVAAAASDTTTTTGTGAVTLSGVASTTPIQGLVPTTFATAFTLNGTIAYPISNVGYVIFDGTNVEQGLGTLTSATNLTRDLVLFSSNAGRHVNFIAGTKTVVSSAPSFYSNAPSWTSVPPSVLPEADIQSGTFTGVLTTGATTTNLAIRYKITGSGQVSLQIPAGTVNGAGTNLIITGIPSFLSGGVTTNVPALVTSGGVNTIGQASIAPAGTVLGTGTITLSQYTGTSPITASAVFTTSVVNGVQAQTITYDTF